MAVLHRLDIISPEAHFPLAEALVARAVSSGWEEESLPTGETRLRVHCGHKGVLDALADELRALLPDLVVERAEVEDQDWTSAWRDFFTPVAAGDFLILPPWLRDTDPQGRRPVLIEPGSAFGTGHHPTTTLCLEALSRLRAAGLVRAGQKFLDLGTGTGILGIACTRLGLQGLGLDIDPLAVNSALENLSLNQAKEAFEVRAGSADAVAGQSYDLVMANILAAPLRDMAASIMALVRPGGCLVLSGFLRVQTPGVEAAYAPMGRAEHISAPSASGDPTRAGSGDPAADEWVCLFWPDFR
ncbi:MAG: 50S ribosomal protein L11 methyltransferase [Desulfovibrionaceae bacterium]|nr:50S ribosomal protein L11 methyltransferase [Desulfovibrionaceae bacterium]